MTLTWDEWLAVATVATPLCVKAFADVQVWLVARKHSALAAIVGMAGRRAASMAWALSQMPAGSTDRAAMEKALVKSATDAILAEMDVKAAVLKTGAPQVQEIVQGELHKVLVSLVAVPPINSQPR
jgi:hypothetical protein